MLWFYGLYHRLVVW